MVDPVDALTAAIEHKTNARRRPLKGSGLTKLADHVGPEVHPLSAALRHPEEPSSRKKRQAPIMTGVLRLGLLIASGCSDGVKEVGSLRQDRLLEHRTVGNRAVERSDPFDRRIEFIEEIA